MTDESHTTYGALTSPVDDSGSARSFSVAWRRVTSDDVALGRRFLEVMCEMDHHYAEGDWDAIFGLMTGEGCKYYVGEGDAFELVIGYQWDGGREKYQIRSAGFRGQIECHEALRGLAENTRAFLSENQQSGVYAIVPLVMDNPRIVQLYGLIPWYPGWKVTGGHHVVGGTYWKIELADSEVQ
jgi:hypothetical protein